MHIRKLTIEDGEALWNLRLRALKDNPEAFAATYEETLKNGQEQFIQRMHPREDAFYLGAFEPELVGVVYFRRDEGRKNQHKGRVLGMYVRPENRGQEIGKALLREVITQANLLPGLEQLHLMVVTTNHAARALYRSMGFEVYGTLLHAFKLDQQYWDEELMVMPLK
ncbi:MAG TPA: N-acetyltransferase [Ktedonobacteraceae bacterium]|nr:N-acetyltransferase [Ktedonobacteraceae bacterium]